MPTLDLITPGGTTYSLSDGNPFALMDEETGMAGVRRITDRGPLQDGDSDIDFRLEPSVYPLGLLMYAADVSSHYTNRATALRIFRPSKTASRLKWTLDNGDVRQIDVHVTGRLVFGSKEQRGFAQRFAVPLRAADPTYYDPTTQSVAFGVGGGAGSFVVPIVVPMAVGASTVNQTQVVVYPGTWRAYPIVQILGPITSPVITNSTTGDKLDFTGTTIAAANTYTIDCRPGHKTVTNQAGTNKIADLTDDSDLQTFSLEADEEAPGGQNTFTVTGSGATSATQVNIIYNVRYVGI